MKPMVFSSGVLAAVSYTHLDVYKRQVLVGAMVALGAANTPLEKTIGFIGVLLAAGNAVGGYAVTERMLEMFKSSRPKGPAAPGGPH